MSVGCLIYTVYKMFSFVFVLSRSPDLFVEVFIKCNNLNLVQMCLLPQRAHWLYPTSTRPQPPSPGSQAPPMEDPPSPAMLLRSERAGKPHFPSWRRFPLTNWPLTWPASRRGRSTLSEFWQRTKLVSPNHLKQEKASNQRAHTVRCYHMLIENFNTIHYYFKFVFASSEFWPEVYTL